MDLCTQTCSQAVTCRCLVYQRHTESDQDRQMAFAECLFLTAGESARPAQEVGCVTVVTGV